MKVKLKLDKDAILGGLIAHGEKIGFGVFILLFLLLCVGALKQSPYDKTPEKFKSEVTRVDAAVSSSVFDKAKELEQLPSVETIKTTEIPHDRFASRDPYNFPPSESGSQRRGEPPYLTVKDLQVGTEYGAVAVRPAGAPAAPRPGGPPGQRPPAGQPAAGDAILGKQWAVVTGVIPSTQQLKEFRAAFASSPQGAHDSPHWKGFEIQRQEGEGPWTPLDLKSAFAAEGAHAGADAESIDKAFVALQDLCRPLPKMIGKDHDHSVIHPKIVQAAEDRASGKPQAVQTAAPPAAMQGAGAGRSLEVPSQFQVDQLFRFFDYTVKPGKTYRYKVCLVLENPNRDLARYLVKDGKLLQGPTRTTAWSEPSPPVSIPSASSMLAGAVERPRGVTQEPKTEAVVRMWDSMRAVDALKFARLVRGQMANFYEDAPVPDPRTGKVINQLVNFQTNLVLIDLAGGETLAGYRGRAPGRMLMMNPSGELDVRSELADLEPYTSEFDRIVELHDTVVDPDAEEKKDNSAIAKDPPKEDGGRRRRGGDK
ncbi:MAG TPA: hypothetical protein VGJ26_07175 [Pirellulales bacterium]|jgi:hypothetical protein